MYVLTATTGEYSDSSTIIIAVSRDSSKLEARIELEEEQSSMRKKLFEQLNTTYERIGPSFPKITDEELVRPRPLVTPKTGAEHAAWRSVKQEYENRVSKWSAKRQERIEAIREAAIDQVMKDNPGVTRDEFNYLSYGSVYAEIEYEIKEVEEIF